jgi:hypothetical protein
MENKSMTTKEIYEEAKKTVRAYEQLLKQDIANCFVFNLNNSILVKLKEDGFQHWLEDSNRYLAEPHKTTIRELKNKCDEDGYIEFQMWEFMRIFGSTISFGSSPIFETDVRFYKLEMKTP